ATRCEIQWLEIPGSWCFLDAQARSLQAEGNLRTYIDRHVNGQWVRQRVRTRVQKLAARDEITQRAAMLQCRNRHACAHPTPANSPSATPSSRCKRVASRRVIPSSFRHRLITSQVAAMSLSKPTEKRIRPSLIPIFNRSSSGISAEVLWPGALNSVLK